MEKVKDIHQRHQKQLSRLDQFALAITRKVGTMGFFFFCIALTITPFLIREAMPYVQFISSAFLQLVLLPIIMIGQNIQAQEAERQAKIDFDINQKAEQEIEMLMEKLHLIHNDIKK
jgi:uncharacterized membrane protein